MALNPQAIPIATFMAAKSQADIAGLFGVTEQRLKFHLYSAKAPKYRTFTIAKAGGGHRSISAPPTTVRLWQSRLASLLAAIYVPKHQAHGFIFGRSVASNARMHIGRYLLLNIDIEDFFTTIHFGRVRGVFLKPPFSFPPTVAATLAQLCTLEGRLPQGAPTSPILSNFVCRRLDTDLGRLGAKYACRVTRYADDITISSNAIHFPSELIVAHDRYGTNVTLGVELIQLVSKHNFSVQSKKTRIQARWKRQEVTGLVVNQKLNVRREYVRRIRATLNDIFHNGYSSAEAKFQTLDATRMSRIGQPPSLTAHLRGKLEYLRMVRDDGDAIYTKYALVARKLKIDIPPVRIIGRASRHKDFIEESIWVVIGEDLAGNQVAQGTAFFLEHVGMVTASHIFESTAVPVTKWSLINRRPPYPTAKILGYTADPHIDLAIMNTDAVSDGSLRAATIEPNSGDSVSLVGYPNWHSMGDQTLMADSPIVQIKHMSGLRYGSVGFTILSGASGAPVLDALGRVVGVVVHSDGHKALPNAFLSIAHISSTANGAYHAL